MCPLPVPARPWEDLSLDFIVGLPPYKGHSALFVVVDKFSKGVHLGSLPAHYTTFEVARLFIEISGKIHGPPRSLVSDRDPLFISHFWQELFKLSGTTLRMSTAYHPQTDGQTEVMNRILKQYLRAFVHTSVHSTMGMSPYEVTFGKKPPNFPQYLIGDSNVDVVDTWLIDRDTMIQSLTKKLHKAQARMKEIADKKSLDLQEVTTPSRQSDSTASFRLSKSLDLSLTSSHFRNHQESFLSFTVHYYGPTTHQSHPRSPLQFSLIQLRIINPL